MERTGHVVKTPEGNKNVNKFRLPEFGVVAIQLKANGKASKVQVPAGARAGGDAGSEEFHFVPEYEAIEIHYQLNNPTAVVKGAKLELFTSFNSTSLFSLDLETLGDTWIKHGKHIIKWDGRIPAAKAKLEGTFDKGKNTWSHDLTRFAEDKTQQAFPDGYVTLEHTPYKLKLTLTSSDAKIKGKPATGWTHFHILVKSIELALGPEESVPALGPFPNDIRHRADKAVWKRIDKDGGLPTPTGSSERTTRKVVLVSNIFKVKGIEMHDETAFNAYRSRWGNGPNIPIVAKIRLADSADKEVKIDETPKGAVALGRAKFLWDWEDPEEDIFGIQTNKAVKTFLTFATDYFKNGTDPINSKTRGPTDHTYPKGDNCHTDRGGKRGPGIFPDGGPNSNVGSVFPTHPGYAPKDALEDGKFPFKVESGASGPQKRRWAAFSEGWTRGRLKGQTGVVFQPSRMAGDDYTVTVYLANAKSKDGQPLLDSTNEPLAAPAATKKSTGKFQVWRELYIARYIRKTASIDAFLPGKIKKIQSFFNRAYLKLENRLGGSDNNYLMSDHRLANGKAPNYNALLRARLTGTGDRLFTKNLATESSADHASVDSTVLTRPYGEFVRRLHDEIHGIGSAAGDFNGLIPRVEPEELGTLDVKKLIRKRGRKKKRERRDRLMETRNQLFGDGLDTEEKYCEHLNTLCKEICVLLADDLQFISGAKTGTSTRDPVGATIVQFNYTHTALRDFRNDGGSASYTAGKAINPADSDRQKCAFLLWEPDLKLAAEETFPHELGHELFLPHARYPLTGNTPKGSEPDFHDDADELCMMSYEDEPHGFCGLCQLRLRGWSRTWINKNGNTEIALSKIAKDNQKP